VFERGVTTAVTGTDFGLAIGREIASAHGWDVSATESDEGGARIEISGVEPS
jgi:signal transduction histidine kinase